MKIARYALNVIVVLALALGSAFALTRPALAVEDQRGTTLTASKTATGSWERTFEWTIEKDVEPSVLNMFKGDSGDVTYTITVTKDSGTDVYFVSGEICVTNGGDFATENLQILDTIQYKVGSGPFEDYLTVAVDLGEYAILDPYESHCYPYSIEFTPVEGATYRNTTLVTITNHAGWIPGGHNCPGPDLCPFGPNPKTDFSIPATPTLINDSINVDDTNGGTWWFGDSGSTSYSKTFTCNDDEGNHHNVATIRETGQSDDADVQVNCFELSVAKTAFTSFTRTYEWDIAKTGSESFLTLATGEMYQVTYDVTVTNTGYTDSDWAVEGEITITNPAPMAANLASVTDSIAGSTVVCPAYVVPAEGELVCEYYADLPNADPFTNYATATLINTPSGYTDFTGSTDVSFDEASITEVSACAEVTDTLGGYLGTVCVGDSPHTFTYTYWVGPYEVCGQYRVDNTATFTTTTDTGSADWTVVIDVPCPGCTLTPGYWKTHSTYGPAPYDDTWGGRETDPFFLSDYTWYGIMWRPPAGNPYYQLSFHYIAAYLNRLNGAASTPAVDAAMTWAENFFSTTLPNTKFSKAQKNQIVGYAGILGSYNEGLIGPGHCDE